MNTDIRACIKGKTFRASRSFDSSQFTEAHEWSTEWLENDDAIRAEIFDSYGLVWDNKNGMNLKNR